VSVKLCVNLLTYLQFGTVGSDRDCWTFCVVLRAVANFVLLEGDIQFNVKAEE